MSNGSRATSRTTRKTRSGGWGWIQPCRTGSSTRNLHVDASRLGCDQLHIGKISSMSPHVARQDRNALDLRMRADEEVGQDAQTRAAGPAVALKDLTGDEQRLLRH